jgi:hypothetical protein
VLFRSVVTIVFAVVIAKQEAGVSQMRACMLHTRFDARAGVQVQAHQPRKHEAETDQPEGGTLAHVRILALVG